MQNDNWLTGTVRRGDGRGHELGFPTANIILDKQNLRPARGIYACLAKIDNADEIYKGALHVGPVPTFDKKEITVELHLLNYAGGDLYDKRISFTCVKYLRDVIKFDTIEKLKFALAQDCAEANKVLKQ